uniref:Lactamase, beta-like 1a n=1 Tax=Neogobius melanostomus TaxID=47308 RepID=A0A8C6UBJ7_9GOBI
MCPRFPEPVPLTHPITSLRVALEKVDVLLRSHVGSRLPAMSAVVLLNDSVLWNAHFGKRNTSDPSSPPPNEYTVYRIASVSKIFPTLMLYKLWEEGSLRSLDDPLDKYVPEFSIKNPLGAALTLRRMASQLSGLPRRLRSTNLLWGGDTDEALQLLQDDVLVADPGTRCHYSNVAFSLLGRVLGERVARQDFESWVSENILQRLNMEDTSFQWGPLSGRPLAVGVYSSGQPAPLYDLGWYRPAGQMYSTTADMAKLTMALLGVPGASLLRRDTLTTMLTPLFRCHTGYFANATGTPWEVNQQLGYDVVRKDGDLDGYAATLSLVPRLNLGLVLLMAGVRPTEDLVRQANSYLIPAIENAFREAPRTLRADSTGVLVMQQFGPQVNASVPAKYLRIRLDYLDQRVFRVVFDTPYPCKLKVHSSSVSLETQDRQLFNFYKFNNKGLSPGFDSPGLNTYRVHRIAGRPLFTA